MSYNIRIKIKIYFRTIILIKLYFLKNSNLKKKIEREMSYFLQFFIFIIVTCIWKVYYLKIYKFLEIIVSTKE